MLATLICPGPSAAGLPTPPGLVCVVNRSALWHDAAYWSALDYQTVTREAPNVVGSPLLLTRADGRRKYAKRPGPDLESLADYCPPDVGYGVFSATAGLVLLASLGATTIDVYGVDRTDGPDHDGVTPPGAVRTAARWATEAALWDATVRWLAGRRVTVERITDVIL